MTLILRQQNERREREREKGSEEREGGVKGENEEEIDQWEMGSA